MHKQGEIGSPLCKVLPVEDYIYRDETKKDRYSVRYEWLQSLQSIPEGTQQSFSVCVPLSFCTNCTRNDHSYPQWVIVPIKESFQLTSLVCFFFLLYIRSGVVSTTAIALKYTEYAHFRQTDALHVQMAHPRCKNLGNSQLT